MSKPVFFVLLLAAWSRLVASLPSNFDRARNVRAVQWSHAAYQATSARNVKDLTEGVIVDDGCFIENQASRGFVGYYESNGGVREIVVAYRGPTVDWDMEMKRYMDSKQMYDDKCRSSGSPAHVHFHLGVYSNFRPTSKTYGSCLVQLLNAYPHVRDVVFTGHSLGGALATFAVYTFDVVIRRAGVQSHLYTFGSPKIGNDKFKDSFEKTRVAKHAFRSVLETDIVPLVPSAQIIIEDVGKVLKSAAIHGLVDQGVRAAAGAVARAAGAVKKAVTDAIVPAAPVPPPRPKTWGQWVSGVCTFSKQKVVPRPATVAKACTAAALASNMGYAIAVSAAVDGCIWVVNRARATRFGEDVSDFYHHVGHEIRRASGTVLPRVAKWVFCAWDHKLDQYMDMAKRL
ncbi:Fungal lipase-like domain-containing protein [Plasmodiophora brassicae]|uniref:Fungal lipase-type domain-containing protein n=1 Tax=Plasmodiophora brassicae TaxID=37360 RepID=A0A0G4IKV1_PLABS|nr:hypothetical protein PBRA_004433 [Plasmodiophora brassicae]SPQ99971.1 unnamed protein product [Plasmodiophora brassicae]